MIKLITSIIIEINPDIDGIEVNNYFYEILKETFFHTYYDKDICMKEKIKFESYIVIYFLATKFKQNDIENFPQLNFINNKIRYILFLIFHLTGEKYFLK